MKSLLLVLLSFIITPLLLAQDSVFIKSVSFVGNDRTKNNIIWREIKAPPTNLLSFAQFKKYNTQNEKQIESIGVFNDVFSVIDTIADDTIKITYHIKKAGRFFATPIVEVADRNLNVWYRDFGADFGRLNLGLMGTIMDINGLNRTLWVSAKTGFVNQLAFSYTHRNFQPSLKHAFKINAKLENSQEFHHAISSNNKQLFYRNDTTNIYKHFSIQATYIYRPKFFNIYSASLAWFSHSIMPSLLAQNTMLLGLNNTKLQYLDAALNWQYRNVDNVYYPLFGQNISIKNDYKINTKSMQLEQAFIYANAYYYWSLPKKVFIDANIKSRLLLKQSNAFLLQRAFGFDGNYVRGYEYYVTNGDNYLILKNEWKKEVFNKYFLKKYSKYTKPIPIAIYPKIYADAGYITNNRVWNESTIANRWSYSIGAGADIRFGNFSVARLEYTLNDLGDYGLYLHLYSL
jgi:hypothetical protein